MKRSIAIFIIGTFLVCISAGSISAQTTGTTGTTVEKLPGSSKDLYVKIVYIMKVYPHALGYRVDYLTANGFLTTTYLPLKWFAGTGNKGELVSEYNSSVPYMEIVFDAGKFRMVRLHVTPNFTDKGWGTLNGSVNIDDKFNVDAPVLTF